VGKFEIQVKEGDGWKKVLEGGAIGPIFKAKIPPVTARQVRLAILSATEGPTIWEFELFAPEKANKGGTKP